MGSRHLGCRADCRAGRCVRGASTGLQDAVSEHGAARAVSYGAQYRDSAGADDPEFWNPKLRAPICLNPPAARTYLPITAKKTELILAGRSKA
jgi:hypothetical protein